MSEPNLLSVVANLLRPASTDISRGKGKLCLSKLYLHKLNKAFDENVPDDLPPSFHLTEAKASLQIDLQFLLDLVKGTVALKVSPDLIDDKESNEVSLRRFQNIKILEIHKIDVKNVIGIQKLRSHIEDLTCMYNLDNLEDILDKCGGDFSHKYNWGELKRVNFSHNRIQDIDTSFESTPWLQMLDLSHNHIKTLEFIDHLPNLKRLNLSYNKLEKVPRFKGQICKRLQVLLLNNNFIEDICGLSTLSDLNQLDLSQNCLMDHNTLLSISQMPSLYSLDLRGNPINFNPIHRTLTCNYLNKNTATFNFILDNIPLTKIEKSLSGSLHPFSQSSLGNNGSYSSTNSLENSMQERQKKVRNVSIQEGYDIKIVKKSNSVTPSPRSSDKTYLDVKNKIEQLRQEYGEKWLSHESGEIFQEVLKFPETPTGLVSSTWKENLASSPSGSNGNNDNPSSPLDLKNASNESMKTDEVDNDLVDDSKDCIYSNMEEDEPVDSIESDDGDIDDGEQFLAGPVLGSFDLCIMITDKHLSERDSFTIKEKARWHINVVKYCQRGENPNEVRMEFNTGRRDLMSRTYYMETPEDADKFVKLVFEGMIRNKVPENRIEYQCMKCSKEFSRTKRSSSVIEEENVTCPVCHSNMVIETK